MRTVTQSALAALLALAVLGAGASPALAQAKALVVAVPSEPSHLDPADSMGIQHDLNYHVYRKLYTFTPEMSVEPDLVASEHVSADLRTWTLELKKGVTFFDGTPVNAAAVKYTIERMLEPSRRAPMAILFRPIKEVRARGEYTVEIETKEPFASLKNNLAHPNAGIISPKADRELGPRFGRAPVSAGPYKIEEWVSGDRIVLTRFDGYKGPRPYYDTIVFRIVPAAETRLAMVERGEAQVAIRMPPAFTRVVAADPDLQVIRLEGTRLFYFWFNLDKPPLNDVRVRRALNLAIDRAAIMKGVAQGAASPARSVMEKIISYSCPVGTLDYDPEQARRLLKEAGAAGARLRIISSEGNHPADRQVAEAVTGYLREAGIVPELTLMSDVAAYTEAMGRREAHMGFVGWGGSTADPDQYFKRQLWGRIAGKPWNFAGYNNPRVDALIDQGARTFGHAERARIYCDAQRLAWNDWPWLVLFRSDGLAFARADLTGIDVYLNSQAHVFTNARPKGK
jgi:peptide/nickel transport system substrate-binding protein